MIKPIQITVGGSGPYDPAVNDTEYNNLDLKGLDGFVDRSGFGTWNYENYEILPSGGFRLLNGFKFSEGEIWFFFPTAYSEDGTATTYTNGFHYSKVIPALLNRLAWRQPTQSEYAILNTANTTSKSGRYFDDFHAVCNAVNVKNICADPEIGAVAFNAFLQSFQKSVILDALTSVFSETEYLCNTLLYNRCRYNDRPLDNEGKFVGVKIKAPNRIGIATQIETLYLYFDKAITFNLYLYHDAKRAPLRTIPVTTVANTQTPITLADCVLNFISDTTGSGDYYLGYFQDDIEALDAKAIREHDIEIIDDQPFGHSFIQANIDATLGFDRLQVSKTCSTYGINCLVSVWRDHTWQILSKAPLLDNLMGLKMAAKVAEMIGYSTRINGTANQLKDANDKLMLYLDLKGTVPISDAPTTEGMGSKIQKEISRVKQGFFQKERSITVNLEND